MAKLLITGGAGFIGSNMAEYFLKQNWEVIAFDNLSRKGVEKNIVCELIRGDVRCPEDFLRLPKVDAIIHLAANPGIPWSIQNPIYDAQVNLMGTLNTLEFARKVNACVVYASSNKVYYDGNAIMDGKGLPHSPYGCSKAAGDLYCQEYNTTFDVPTVVCRMSAIYGERQMGVEEQGWISWFMYAKKHNLPLTIYGDGTQIRDILYISDLTRLYHILITNIKIHRGKVYDIGGGKDNAVNLLEVIDWLNNKGGEKLKLTFKDWRIADHRYYVSNLKSISSYWKPEISKEEGLERTWQWQGL